MTEHVFSKKYLFHERYFLLRINNQDFLESTHTKSKWSEIEPLAVTLPKTSGDHPVDIPRKRDHQVYTPSLQLPSPGIRSMEINRTSRCTYEIDGRGFHLRRIQTRGRKEKGYKKMVVIYTETGT